MIYLCRHSETVWNREGRLQGHKNSELTSLGEVQARRIGEALKREIIEIQDYVLVASPLSRTRRTAEIICGAIGRDLHHITFDARLKEISWGDWEGYTGQEIEERWPGVYAERRKNKWKFQPPNGESYALLTQRVGEWLDEVTETDKLIVVTHGAAGRAIRGIYSRMTPGAAIGLEAPQDAFFFLSGGDITKIAVALP